MQILKSIITTILIILRDNSGEVSPRFENIGGILYYIEGKNRYRITEHFKDQGKSISDLIAKAIEYEQKESGDANL